MLATVGMTVAQDIWSCGEHDHGSYTGVGIYKNGERVETVEGNYNYYAYDITRWNGHTYMSYRNAEYGKAFIRDHEGGSLMDMGDDTYAYKLFGKNNLYAAGYRKNGSVNNATIWILNTGTVPMVLHTWDNGSYDTYAYCGLIGPDSFIYAGGYQKTGSNSWEAVIWKENTGVLYTISQEKSYVLDMAYYDGSVYSLVATNASSTKWVYRDNDLLYTITAASSSIRDLHIESGDIYVCGYEDNQIKVWKNGEAYWTSTVGSSHIHGVWANSEGVYFCGKIGSNGTIWKDGTAIHQPSDCKVMLKLYVENPECANSDVRSLPFTDGFENGMTDWACWTKLDQDDNNGVYVSYWDRVGKRLNSSIPEGDHCAWHRYNGDNDQEGWLISPRLFLQPGRDYTELTFKTNEKYPSYYSYEGVWVSTNSDPTSTSSYTEVWTQSNPSDSWKTVTIDLADYQGQAIYIAFKYTGDDAHTWLIDDVSVEEGWEAPSSATLPYSVTFDNGVEPGWCWYVYDADMSGGQRNWKYNESEQCAYHPWGQSNTPQEGWMVTGNIVLPAGGNYLLTFDEKNYESGANMKNSVLISVDKGATVPNIADFTELWSETSNLPTTWTQRSIDLTAYAGHNINIAFKYEGTYAHNWYVDNFLVEENTPEYNINVVANNAAWGTVTGGGTYPEGASVTINAEAATGYEFKQWTKDGVMISTNATYSFTATEDATYTAVFGEPAVTYYTITVNVNPENAGTVTGGDTYASGATAVLTAIANQGWYFTQWNDGNTDNPRSVTVTGNATYTAQFALIDYTLTVTASPIEGGTVTGAGTYHYGDVVELTATANEGYTFLNWNDGITAATRNVTVSDNAEYTAFFAAEGVDVYTITVISSDPTLGEVSGGGVFPEGSVITITATPIGYATFLNWSDGDTNETRDITVTEDATYIANFNMGTFYTITVVSLNPEMGSVNGGGNFPMGAEVTIQANPFGGYYFDGWNDNSYDNPRTITVTGDATYSAKFSAQQAQTYTLTVSCNPTQGAVTGNGTYTAGTTVTVEAIPYDGFEFSRWNDGVTDNPRSVTINNNMTLVAFFTGTGINENGESVLSLYPNPVNSTLFIEGLEPNSNVLIYNTLGMLVKSVNTDKEVNVSDLAAGVYMIRCGSQILRFVKK